MAGLDPAIHLLRKDSCEDGWMRGSSPRMTIHLITARAAPYHTFHIAGPEGLFLTLQGASE